MTPFLKKQKDFQDFEKESGIFKATMSDIIPWEYIRFTTYLEIMERDKIYNQTTYFKKSRLRKFKKLLGLFQLLKLRRKKFWFFGIPRRKLMKELWVDIYSDYYYEEVKEDALFFEYSYNDTHLRPIKHREVVYLDFIEFLLIAIKACLLKNKATDDNESYESYENSFYQKFAFKLDFKSRFIQVWRTQKAHDLLWGFLIRLLRPQCVFLGCSYGKEALIATLKKNGIQVVEFQHGAISPYHYGYSFYADYAAKKTFPDYFLAFGDFWRQRINFPIDREHIVPVGFPYFEERIRYEASDQQGKKTILVLSQGRIGKYLYEFCKELVESDKFKEYIIQFKLHPGEVDSWEERYPLKNERFQVIADAKKELYQLMEESNVVIGVYSTALYEAYCLNRPVYVLSSSAGIENVGPAIEEGLFVEISNSADLWNSLSSDKTDLNCEYIIASNWKSNFHEFLKNIIESAPKN